MSEMTKIIETENIRYTYADSSQWEVYPRYELFAGRAVMMATPSIEHQRLSSELSRQFGNFLLGKPCRAYASPIDVRLFPKLDKSDDTVMQPDLLVVCDKGKIAKNSIDGAPDLAIEILSPSNLSSRLLQKFNHYLKAGVREFWTIEPEEKLVQVNLFGDDKSVSVIYKKEDASIPVSVLPGLAIDLKLLWP
jgi:Uma2 family endonuclease